MKRSGSGQYVVWLLILLFWTSVANSKSTGSIVGWGRQVVVEQEALEDLVAVAAGKSHSLGLNTSGMVVAWGFNDEGQCQVPEPNEDFVAVTAGSYHSLGLKSDGTIVAWGLNCWGQCDVPEPNTDFIAVAAGHGHSLGLKGFLGLARQLFLISQSKGGLPSWSCHGRKWQYFLLFFSFF